VRSELALKAGLLGSAAAQLGGDLLAAGAVALELPLESRRGAGERRGDRVECIGQGGGRGRERLVAVQALALRGEAGATVPAAPPRGQPRARRRPPPRSRRSAVRGGPARRARAPRRRRGSGAAHAPRRTTLGPRG